jgi:hypothetical protein
MRCKNPCLLLPIILVLVLIFFFISTPRQNKGRSHPLDGEHSRFLRRKKRKNNPCFSALQGERFKFLNYNIIPNEVKTRINLWADPDTLELVFKSLRQCTSAPAIAAPLSFTQEDLFAEEAVA